MQRNNLLQDLPEVARAPADCPLKYTEYIDGSGMALFQRVCDLDLEGIIAKHKSGPYIVERENSIPPRNASNAKQKPGHQGGTPGF